VWFLFGSAANSTDDHESFIAPSIWVECDSVCTRKVLKYVELNKDSFEYERLPSEKGVIIRIKNT